MQKSLCLSLATCFALTGCGLFQPSETWSTVRATRIDTRSEADPSAAYAAQLSDRLTAANIEHQVVTYQFRYRTRMSEESIATRTAVVYRDNVNPRYPWWLMDERLSQPFWLPSGDLTHQLSFYIRRPVDLVETASGSRGGSGKTMTRPIEDHERVAQAAQAKRGPAIAFRTGPKRITTRHATAAAAERKRTSVQSHVSNESGAPRARRSAPAAKFHAIHGTAFDPRSAVDRQKMERLRQGGRGVALAY